jgi:Stress responsive A/B Barrel Domain
MLGCVIRHVVLFRWKPEFDEAGRQDWLNRVRVLPEKIDFVRTLSAGPDVLRATRSWDHAIVADFDCLEDVAAYDKHPDHEPIKAISGPNTEQIVSVDFEV